MENHVSAPLCELLPLYCPYYEGHIKVMEFVVLQEEPAALQSRIQKAVHVIDTNERSVDWLLLDGTGVQINSQDTS